MSFSTLRLAVTGLNGQIVSALIERAPKNVEIIALGRPQLELSTRNSVLTSLRHAHCDAIINAAAYTLVDKAESEPEIAMRVNGWGAANVAEAAGQLNVPLLHLSTDYVFDGLLTRAYKEDDPTGPVSAYGRSKLEGEKKIALTHPNHIILRTSWVFSPFGNNFVKTMLRLARERKDVRVVSDQIGNPTNALDIADGLFEISSRLVKSKAPNLFGTFHMSGQGEASWADMAEVIFQLVRECDGNNISLHRIKTSEYPTSARRPTNSRLDNSKLEKVYGIKLPEWRSSLTACVQRLLKEKN